MSESVYGFWAEASGFLWGFCHVYRTEAHHSTYLSDFRRLWVPEVGTCGFLLEFVSTAVQLCD